MPTRPKVHKPNRRRKRARPKDTRPSASRRGYNGRWQKIREDVYERDIGTCQRCRKLLRRRRKREWHVDHILPISQGGTHDSENLQLLCERCHNRKTANEDGGLGRGIKHD